MTGDADYTDDEINAMGYVAPGADWQKAFILSGSGSDITGMTHGMNETLGRVGNHVGGGIGGVSTAQLDGFQMFYLGADYAVNDDITLGCLIAVSEADDVPGDVGIYKYEEDQGVEVDLKVNWKIMDNLELDGVAAFLSAGDYWDYRETGAKKVDELEDLICVYTRLTLTF
jgi:hypothetical protein